MNDRDSIVEELGNIEVMPEEEQKRIAAQAITQLKADKEEIERLTKDRKNLLDERDNAVGLGLETGRDWMAQNTKLKAENERLREALRLKQETVDMMLEDEKPLTKEEMENTDAWVENIANILRVKKYLAERDTLQQQNAELREGLENAHTVKPIIFGRGAVLVCTAHQEGSTIDDEILLLDIGERRCIGEDCPDLCNLRIENNDPRLLVRLVFENSDGAEVLIAELDKISENLSRTPQPNQPIEIDPHEMAFDGYVKLQKTDKSLCERVAETNQPKKEESWEGEYCDRCGREQRAAWLVTDEAWKRVGAKEEVLCLECFFKDADRKNIGIAEEDFIYLGFVNFAECGPHRPLFIDRTQPQPKKEECPECGGSGKIVVVPWPGEAKIPCPKCGGKDE